MSEVAGLELRVASDGVRVANDRLQAFSASSAAAERAAQQLAQSVDRFTQQQMAAEQRATAAATKASEERARAAEAAAARAREVAAREKAAEVERQQQAILGVKKSLMTQEQLIRQSENERRRIIVTSTAITERERAELLRLSAIKTQTELAASGGAGGSLASMRQLVGPAIAGFASLAAARAAVGKVIGETRDYENLIARLAGVTDGVEAAGAAFERLETISDRTIFTENQMAEAFLHLRQTGLDASERSLKAFANIASATGQSMENLAEMTLSASMGIFRSLRSMGIRAEADGDKIRMTFKGVTTVIGNSAQEIQGYLVKIGETDFAGAAERQLDTLGGSVKNLQDAWGDLFRDIGRSNIGAAIRLSISGAAGLLDRLSKLAKSGSLGRALLAPIPGVGALAGAVGNGEEGAAPGAATIGDPLASTFAAVSDAAEQRDKDDLEKLRTRLRSKTEVLRDSYTEDAQMILRLTKEGSALQNALFDDLERKRREEAGTKDYEPKIQRGKDTDFVAKAKERDAEFQKQFDKIKEISELEEKQREMEARFHEEEKRELEENRREREALYDGLRTEEEELRQSYERRLADIEEYTQKDIGFAMQAEALKAKVRKKYEQDQLQLELGRVSQATQNAEALFGNLAEASRNWGGEQSAAYRAMFATQQAFGVASATVAGGVGLAKALELGWPAGIPAGLEAMAQMARAISIISSASYSGAYDRGGRIPAGQIGLVGEYGPEFVRGPAEVTSRAKTAAVMQAVAGGAGGGSDRSGPTIIVAPDQEAAEQYMYSARGERAWLALAKRNSAVIRRMVGA